jgi:hypothetical protein
MRASQGDNIDWAEVWELYILDAKLRDDGVGIDALLQGALDNTHPTLDLELMRPKLAVLA